LRPPPQILIEADWMHGPSGQAGLPLRFIRVLQARDAGTGSPVSPKGRRRLWSGTAICYVPFYGISQTPPTFS